MIFDTSVFETTMRPNPTLTVPPSVSDCEGAQAACIDLLPLARTESDAGSDAPPVMMAMACMSARLATATF